MHHEDRFWDALAPHHAAVEDNYLDRASLRRIRSDIQSPVLIVGAGQGLLVAELRSTGFQCDGVDFSSEMVRHAKRRRGLDLIHADAQPYRNEAQIRSLFERLNLPIQDLQTLQACWIAQV